MARAATWGRIRGSVISRLHLSSAAQRRSEMNLLLAVFIRFIRARLFTGQTELTYLYLLWLCFPQHAFRQLCSQDTPGSVDRTVTVSESRLPSFNQIHSGFYFSFSAALCGRLNEELIHKCRHLVECNVMETTQAHFLLLTSSIRQKQIKKNFDDADISFILFLTRCCLIKIRQLLL